LKQSATTCAAQFGEARELKLTRALKRSVQSRSLFTACIHRAHFDVVLRKLIFELQAFSQCIQETSMVRFYSSIYADDKMLIRQMSCDSAFSWDSPPKSLPHIERRPNASAAFPTT
jgi:hypothetical protein